MDKDYDDVFFGPIVAAAKTVRSVCRRVDQDDFIGDIPGKIFNLLQESAAVIADLSEAKPNVLYEVAYAHALKIPTILEFARGGESKLYHRVRKQPITERLCQKLAEREARWPMSST